MRQLIDVSEREAQERGGAESVGTSSIQNKGEALSDLLTHPAAAEVVEHVLGEHYQLQISGCGFHKAGAKALPLHTDSWWLPPPHRRDEPPTIKAGDVTRALGYTPAWHPEGDYLTPSTRVGAIWMATAFTFENGAMQIVPGSHNSGRHPSKEEASRLPDNTSGRIPLCAPAGSVALYDGRLWHQKGANLGTHDVDPITGSTDRMGIFVSYSAPFIRQQENVTLTTSRELLRESSDEVREMLGLGSWQGLGRVGAEAPLLGTECGLGRMSGASTSAPQPVAPPTPVEWAAGLPRPTKDAAALRSDLELYGYCIVDSALGDAQRQALATRVAEQAAAEQSAGLSSGDDDVLTCLNKGDEFVELLLHRDVNDAVRAVLGEEFQLSEMRAAVGCGVASEVAPLTTQQWWAPPPIDRAVGVPARRPGSITRELAAETGVEQQEFIVAALAAQVVFAVTDGTALRLAPGSHLSGRHPNDAESESEDATTVSLPAGVAVVLDGRLWAAPQPVRPAGGTPQEKSPDLARTLGL